MTLRGESEPFRSRGVSARFTSGSLHCRCSSRVERGREGFFLCWLHCSVWLWNVRMCLRASRREEDRPVAAYAVVCSLACHCLVTRCLRIVSQHSSGAGSRSRCGVLSSFRLCRAGQSDVTGCGQGSPERTCQGSLVCQSAGAARVLEWYISDCGCTVTSLVSGVTTLTRCK